MVRSLAVFCFLCLVMAVTYFIKLNASQAELIELVIQSDCHLSETHCEVLLDNNSLHFDLSPKSLPVMEPLTLNIEGLGAELAFEKAWFEGKDMNMGKHFLIPGQNLQSSNSLALQGMIPVCHIDSEMIWKLMVEFRQKQALIQVQFELQTLAK